MVARCPPGSAAFGMRILRRRRRVPMFLIGGLTSDERQFDGVLVRRRQQSEAVVECGGAPGRKRWGLLRLRRPLAKGAIVSADAPPRKRTPSPRV